MQKFVTHNLYGMNEHGAAVTEVLPAGEPKHVYLASDVDKYRETSCDITAANGRALTHMVSRINELEKALREILGAATVTPTTVTQKACEVPREILGRARNALMER